MIEFQISARQTGKTTLLFKWMAEVQEGTRPVMICHSNESARRAWKRSKDLGYNFNKNQFLGLHEALSGALRGRLNYEVCIDNLDLMLGSLFVSTDIKRVTATGVDILHE